MKKLGMLLALVLTVCMLGGALAETKVANPGKDVTVDVDVSSKDAAFGIVEYEYNKDVLEYQGTEFSEEMTDKGMVTGASDGRIAVAQLLEKGGITGVIGAVKFKVKDNAKLGTYDVAFSTSGVYNKNEKATKMTAKKQQVTVESLINSFVRRCYSLILGRDPDEGGLKGWSEQLEAGTRTASEIITQFTHSPEFIGQGKTNDETVEILYNTMMSRESDPEGKAGWVSFLDAGCSDALVINGFCGSQEFSNLCDEYGITAGTTETEQRDRNMNVTAFVSRCYSETLNRKGDVGGLNYWCELLLDRVQTPKEVAHGFVFSPEMINRDLSNGEFVDTLYRLYMDRDADEGGRAYWIGMLESGVSPEDVNNGFADSLEFANIVASYGL